MVATVAIILSGCGPRACSRSNQRTASPSAGAAEAGAAGGTALRVPFISGAINCDGELEEPEWLQSARTGPFLGDDSTQLARPFSEARFLRDKEFLYVALYAADQDIVAFATAHDSPVWLDDSFAMRFGPAPTTDDEFMIDVSATGVVMDARKVGAGPADKTWESGAVVGVDRDGTLNTPGDDDEEWVVEMRLPLASLCPRASCTALPISVRRCDQIRSQGRRCGHWGGSGSTARWLDLTPPTAR